MIKPNDRRDADRPARSASGYDLTPPTREELERMAAGLTPGATVNHDGVAFTWPNAAAGTADNFIAGGQDTSALNDLGYAGFTAPPLNHTFDGSTRVGDVLSSPIFGQSFTTPAIASTEPFGFSTYRSATRSGSRFGGGT